MKFLILIVTLAATANSAIIRDYDPNRNAVQPPINTIEPVQSPIIVEPLNPLQPVQAPISAAAVPANIPPNIQVSVSINGVSFALANQNMVTLIVNQPTPVSETNDPNENRSDLVGGDANGDADASEGSPLDKPEKVEKMLERVELHHVRAAHFLV